MYDFGARFYDPYLARFIGADNVVPGAGNPQALNRYAYTLNNPVKYVDPSGHASCIDIEDCGGEDIGGVPIGGDDGGGGGDVTDLHDYQQEVADVEQTFQNLEQSERAVFEASDPAVASASTSSSSAGPATSSTATSPNLLPASGDSSFWDKMPYTVSHYTDDLPAIQSSGDINSPSGETYYSPHQYASATEAQSLNAMPRPPTDRIDGIELKALEQFNARVVGPAYGQPGGGFEIITSTPYPFTPALTVIPLLP